MAFTDNIGIIVIAILCIYYLYEKDLLFVIPDKIDEWLERLIE